MSLSLPHERTPHSAHSEPSAWSRATRDRSFLVLFVGSLVAVFVIIAPFLDALLFASATAVVTWPLFEAIRRRTGNRVYVASFLTTSLVVLLLLVPVLLLGLWLFQQAAHLVGSSIDLLRGPDLRAQLDELVIQLRSYGGRWLGDRFSNVDPVGIVIDAVRRNLMSFASSIPDVLGSILVTAIDVIVYIAALITLYAEGPRLLRGAGRLSPLRAEYQHRLFEVFREFSTNLVFGVLVTAFVQAVVAVIGYAIGGSPNLVVLGFLTMIFSFVPIIGTSIVWIPVVVWVGLNHGWQLAAVVAAWQLGFTGTIDNILRPLLLRGRSPIHPLAIFLSVLGGLALLGLPGALVGPVCVAVFLALYRIWTEELEEQGIRFQDSLSPTVERAFGAPREGAELRGPHGAGADGWRRAVPTVPPVSYSSSSSSMSSSSASASSASASASAASASAPSTGSASAPSASSEASSDGTPPAAASSKSSSAV
jgi:predicted PurR-regulated permease PerM